MNMWGSLFGGGATAAKKKQDAAKNSIVKLREQVNMLEKKEAHLQKQIDELTATAKRNVQTNKKGKPHPASVSPALVSLSKQRGRD
jgi:charged multivesicular body protein 4A/B